MWSFCYNRGSIGYKIASFLFISCPCCSFWSGAALLPFQAIASKYINEIYSLAVMLFIFFALKLTESMDARVYTHRFFCPKITDRKTLFNVVEYLSRYILPFNLEGDKYHSHPARAGYIGLIFGLIINIMIRIV
jgi:hypothetical protein